MSEIAHISHSIIFIGNLHRRNLTPWKAPGDIDWFEERLPKKFPSARTFLYRYYATQPTLAGTVDDAAAHLLLEWERLGADASRDCVTDSSPIRVVSQRPTPIIFACHGLGGIVVKKVP